MFATPTPDVCVCVCGVFVTKVLSRRSKKITTARSNETILHIPEVVQALNSGKVAKSWPVKTTQFFDSS